jgi:DNA-binding XRE family transcriptional regulator
VTSPRRGEVGLVDPTTFKPADVKAVRKKLPVSQGEVANTIGVSVATLRNWEQGRRVPEGPDWRFCVLPPRTQRQWSMPFTVDVERPARKATPRHLKDS